MLLPLAGCLWGPERICEEGKVMVLHSARAGSGSYCTDRSASDMECPEGQILRRIETTGREDCIENLLGHERDGL
jgi:hypothetical protein